MVCPGHKRGGPRETQPIALLPASQEMEYLDAIRRLDQRVAELKALVWELGGDPGAGYEDTLARVER